MAEESQPQENWKQFQGTELGSLMSQLYGNQNRPKINYPKPKTKVQQLPSKDFICGGNKDASDPRKSTKREVNVTVPNVGKKCARDDMIIHPIDCLARRRTEDVIKKELDDMKMKQSYYRPAYSQAISSDAEKERLSQINTYKGGKALPGDCVLPTGEAPYERIAKIRQQELLDKHNASKGRVQITPRLMSTLSANEQLIDQITDEINERREYLEDMKKCGNLSEDKELKIKNEISSRLLQLKKLDT